MSVVRGIPVAPTALRLRRERLDPGEATPESVSPQQVFETARAAGRSEGVAQGRQEGWQRGYEEGLAEARLEAARELDARTAEAVQRATVTLREERARLAEIAGRVAALHDEVLHAAEDELVALAYEAITRLVAGVAVQPDAVRATLQSALARAFTRPRVLLRVHPEDAALLDACGLHGHAEQVVAWRADDEVALAGCVVESPGGALDLRLDVLLADCRATLLRVREDRRAVRLGAGKA